MLCWQGPETPPLRKAGARQVQDEIRNSGDTMKRHLATLASLLLAAAAWAQSGVTIPAGTALNVKLETTLATFSNRVGDPFQGRLTSPVVIEGKTVIPAGTTVQGRVTKINEPRRIAGKPTIAILPEALVLPNGERYALNATLVDTTAGNGSDVNDEGQFKGAGHTKRDLWEIGGGTGAGMLIGGLAGGGKGLLIGGLIGAGATAGHWLSKRNSATLPSGTELVMEVSRAMTIGNPAPAAGQ
jgi:hypothetical protein